MLTPPRPYSRSLRCFVRSSPFAFGFSVVAVLALGLCIAQPVEAKGRPNPPPSDPPSDPVARAWHAMSGDGSVDQHGVYLYGGTTDATGDWRILDDFWFYDLNTLAWRTVKVSGKTRPGAKQHASFACGPNECVLAHGWPSNFKGAGTDTWRYSKATSSWSGLNCSVSFCPGPRMMASLEYDSARASFVLFGGQGRRAADFLGDTYDFTAGVWTQHSPKHSPSPRFAAATAFVPTINKVVLFGGQLGYSETPNACDMWAWDGNDWQEIPQTGGPCLAAHSMTWDTSTSPPRLLVTGGYTRWNYMERNPDVWTFTFDANGKSGTWAKHAPTSLSCHYATPYIGNGAPLYPGSKMAADGNPNKKVFFGGEENLANGAVAYAGLIVCD